MKIYDFKENIKKVPLTGLPEYIWTYYKIPILAAACILVLVISLANALLNNALSDPVLSVGVTGQVDTYCSDRIDALLAETFPGSTGYQAPVHSNVTSPADEKNPYGPVQLMSYLAAGDLDTLIADTATVDFFLSSNSLIKVEDISDTSLGKDAAAHGVSPLFYIILPDNSKKGNSDDLKAKQEAAERFLEAIRQQ